MNQIDTSIPRGWLTVKRLKEIVAEWPSEDKNGDDTEVWMMTGGSESSQVVSVSALGSDDIVFDVQREDIP
jgi:hypothetical protein